MFQALGRVLKVEHEHNGPCFKELLGEGVTEDDRMKWTYHLLNAFSAM